MPGFVLHSRLLILLVAACHLQGSIASTTTYRNVYGAELQPCSQPDSNMALTGYTRNGSCIDKNDDSGSHHICIDISSREEDFCTVTGQSDWCSSNLPCDAGNGMEGDDDEGCPIENWCVCQWAFASYISAAGGCDEIQEIQCDSVNLQALGAYSRLAGTSKDPNGEYAAALECIEYSCGVDSSSILELYPLPNHPIERAKYALYAGRVPLLFGTVFIGISAVLYRRMNKQEGRSDANVKEISNYTKVDD